MRKGALEMLVIIIIIIIKNRTSHGQCLFHRAVELKRGRHDLAEAIFLSSKLTATVKHKQFSCNTAGSSAPGKWLDDDRADHIARFLWIPLVLNAQSIRTDHLRAVLL